MINIIMAAALAVSPALEAKEDLAFDAGVCHNSGWTASEATRLEMALKALPADEQERAYLHAAFEAGREFSAQLWREANIDVLMLATKDSCKQKLKVLFNG